MRDTVDIMLNAINRAYDHTLIQNFKIQHGFNIVRSMSNFFLLIFWDIINHFCVSNVKIMFMHINIPNLQAWVKSNPRKNVLLKHTKKNFKILAWKLEHIFLFFYAFSNVHIKKGQLGNMARLLRKEKQWNV